MKTIFIITCFFFMCYCGTEDDFKKIDSLTLEEPCTSSGGMCVFAADCPSGQLTTTSGLCPKQQALGVECCNGISVKETRCRKHGGSCFPKDTFCNKNLLYEEATDCKTEQKCCILV